MKKLHILFFCILPILFCIGCGETSENIHSEPLTRAAAPLRNDELITVGFIQTRKESGRRDAITDDLKNTFNLEKGYLL